MSFILWLPITYVLFLFEFQQIYHFCLSVVFFATHLKSEAFGKLSAIIFSNIFSADFLLFLLLAALGLHCCTRTFSSCGERGLLFLAVHGLLIAVDSLVVEHGL